MEGSNNGRVFEQEAREVMEILLVPKVGLWECTKWGSSVVRTGG